VSRRAIDRRWISGAALAAALILGLSSCRFDHVAGAGSSQTNQPASVGTGSASPAPTGGAPAATSAAGAGSQSSGLARVSSDLSGIDAGDAQAGTDVSAGDSDRTQPDTP
jgi:hypothetical protein